MRAAAHTQAPVQGFLLPDLQPPPDTPCRFAVMGLLRDQAKVYVSGNRVLIEVVVMQHLQQHPEARHVVAAWVYPWMGDLLSTEKAARALAARMAAHAEVVVTGSALYPGTYHGTPVSLLDSVGGIALASELHPRLS